VEHPKNEVGLSTIGTSYQSNGRAINLANCTQVLAYEVPHLQSFTIPTPFHLPHLLSLLSLHARSIKGTKLLVDYNKPHVITIEYLEIMRQKVTKKEVAKHIREAKRKEREEQNDR
jgi:hypothetical protein